MTLLEKVVGALAETVVSIDLGDELAMDGRLAAQILDDLAEIFDPLDDEERERLVRVIDAHARTVSDPRRKEALAGIREFLDLTDWTLDQRLVG